MSSLRLGPAARSVVFTALIPLTLAACSTVRPAGPPPADTAFFIAPVFAGDTITSFAARYGVEKEQLLALNNIRDRNRRLGAGSLRVPASAQPRPAPASAPPATPAVEARVEPATEPAVVTPQPPVIQPQPRPSSIDRRSLEPLAVPPGRRTSGARDNMPVVPISRPAPSEVPAAQGSAEGTWPDWMTFPSTEPAVPPTAQRFRWPVDGPVISTFGNSTNGGRNDGINIAAARGTPVHAAESGEVSYVGNELKGYGNLILIRHEDGFVTAYAHTDGVRVKRGDRVERGQVIASAGDTGDVTQPQLHFELRQGTKPLDPTRFLPAADSAERLAEGAR
jgi:murein DD-endopeptidase MepM/ murein hydrolase activator NlpD